jgi:ADP-ribose pyrophosphatase YjhB (NUDIX family)
MATVKKKAKEDNMNGNKILRPELTVAAVVEERGRFLMVEEMVHGQAVFNQPAGHVETGETLRAAVMRETLEEAAWHFIPEFITGIYLWQPPGSQRSYLRVAIRGQLACQERGRELDEGIMRSLWLSREALEARPVKLRSPLVLRSIDDYLAGHRLPLESGDLTALASQADVI